MKLNNRLLLPLIVVIGFFLRTTFLDKFPPSPNWDEVSHGYNAFSILETAKDEWGKFLPLSNFRAYGDYPLALNLYLTIPFIWVFGLDVFSIRLPHAILGALSVITSYYLAIGLTKSKKISLLSALLVAIEPWNLFLSRFVIQANLSIFFLTAALALFFNRRNHRFFLPLSFLSFGLTLYSYHTTRIITPLLLFVLLVIFGKKIKVSCANDIKARLFSICVLVLFFLPLPFILINPESRARSSEVFIIDQGAVNLIEEKRNTTNYPVVVSKLIYNRPVYFVSETIKNYIGYFSPSFLFFKGGTQHQFSVPDWGLLYTINLPFFYYGGYLLFYKALKKNKNYIFVSFWLLVSPIVASITKENFAVLRSTPMLPVPQLLTSLGAVSLYKKISKKYNKLSLFVFCIYLFILLFSVKSYLAVYYKEYAKDYFQDWQYGYKEVVNYAIERYSSYDKIVTTKKYGEPHEFFLFYTAWNPQKYRNDPNLIRFYQSNWYWVDRFDKFYFVNDWDIPGEGYELIMESGGKIDCSPVVSKCLLITSPASIPDGWTKLKTIYFLDGSSAFEIMEN